MNCIVAILLCREPVWAFEKGKIKLGSRTIDVEFSKTDAEHMQGLMFRTKLPKDSGMLFIFKDEQERSFWMKNTLIDLSIGYFDQHRTLVDVQEMKGTTTVLESNPPSYPSKKPAMYALEMNKFWFKKNSIEIGTRFEFVKTRPSSSK